LNCDWKEEDVVEETVVDETRVGGGIEGTGLTIGVGLGKLGCGCDATIGFGGCC
jgi:hypothetical protein